MGYHFAWVDPTETTFLPAHERTDLAVTAFERVLVEGEFPRLSVTVLNPRVGLLSPSRKRWIWFAWDGDGATSGAVPLFFGRLVGVPSDLQAERLTLEFLARPQDWDAQRAALAETLKVRPFWAPEWLDAKSRGRPDAVLEARPVRWHVDPVTHLVTVSDIIAGEDGVVDLGPGAIVRESVRVTPGPPPKRRIRVEATAAWEQAAAGVVDIAGKITRRSAALGGGYPFLVASYTGQGLQQDWPKPDTSIGGGWTVEDSSAERVDGGILKQDVDLETGAIVRERTVSVWTADGAVVHVPLWLLDVAFSAHYETRRSFSEVVTFTLEADVQEILVEPGDEEYEEIVVSAAVDEPVDPPTTAEPDGVLPIGDVRRRSFFLTDRGRQSLEYLISRARSELLWAARAVTVGAVTDFVTGIDVTTRHSARLHGDARVPGGEATGKVTGAVLRQSESGRRECEVQIGCTIGRGATVSTVAGDPVYVEAGYVEAGYQAYEGRTIAPIAGEVTYEDYAATISPNDDGVDFIAGLRPADVIEDLTITGHSAAQKRALSDPVWAVDNREDGVSGEVSYVEDDVFGTAYADPQSVLTALKWHRTRICVTFVPFEGGPFETDFPVVVSDLMVPKTIDLEAS